MVIITEMSSGIIRVHKIMRYIAYISVLETGRLYLEVIENRFPYPTLATQFARISQKKKRK